MMVEVMRDADSIKLGVVGLGAAAQAFFKSFSEHAGIHWIALAEPSQEVRAQFHRTNAHLGVREYTSIESMLTAEPSLDVVYIATPTDLHKEQTLLALSKGKHVLVEKPMASNLEDAILMVSAAKAAQKHLWVGHSHSYDLPILEMRRIIESHELGRVRMVNTWCFTDWMYRPRRAEEFDERLGGGVTFRQGSHQFDIIRLLCGGVARSVRAKTFNLDPQRSGIGAHTVFIDFESDSHESPCATAIYNGYAGLSSMDLGFDISEWGFHEPLGARKWNPKPTHDLSAQEELKAKRARSVKAIPTDAPHQPFFGLTVVSCDLGDIRQSPNGLIIDSRMGRQEKQLPLNISPRDLVVQEMYATLKKGEKPVHTGAWGLANLEICQASIESSRLRSEVYLKHQVGL
jgi:phthalate 4,5-cis-dihydrodiol dehydrogenase